MLYRGGGGGIRAGIISWETIQEATAHQGGAGSIQKKKRSTPLEQTLGCWMYNVMRKAEAE